jgi:rfaE bifunctional protein nucleotidyltransferase chain/domain
MLLRNNKELVDLRKKNYKKIIGLCHGVFDILHNGHIDHFKEAKKKCDILVVSITDDVFVKKGPHQPHNSSLKRIQILDSLKIVDHVYINKYLTPIKLISLLKPDYYFKGHDYSKPDLTGNLKKENQAVKKNNGKLFITKTKIMSSTKILNNQLIPWTANQKNFLKKINSERSFDYIISQINKLKNIQINIIGEPIIDDYTYAKIVGLSSKDTALSGIVASRDIVPGGVIPAAQIASLFVNKVNLYTYGNNSFIKKNLNKNIILTNVAQKQLIQKKIRYVNNYRFQKILQLANFEKNIFSSNIQKKIYYKLKKAFSGDLIICDFGLGLLDGIVIDMINNSKNPKYINVQSNSINFGFNLFTKYKKNKSIKYISLNEREWKLGMKGFYENGRNFKKFLNPNTSISITLGKDGSKYYESKKNFYCPVFVDKIVDTTGCGDAYFIITSLLKIVKTKPEFIPFLGNVYAGMHAMNVANKNIPSKIEYIKYIKSLLTF